MLTIGIFRMNKERGLSVVNHILTAYAANPTLYLYTVDIVQCIQVDGVIWIEDTTILQKVKKGDSTWIGTG